MKYPWYEIVNSADTILQGDLIPDCPIIIPPKYFHPDDIIDVDVQLINSIILSQSCDLENDKLEIVLVCPYHILNEFIESNEVWNKSLKSKQRVKDNLRKGFFPGYHLLNKFDGYLADYLVVDFKNVFGINIQSLKNIVLSKKERVRLLPPYREHLSQAFARYFMRVGLPQDIYFE